ncbi:glycosyltransferase family 1 protein [Bacteroides oleiciplenus]|uniref:glycosyltransferase family 1 protein n=1 Tax=Bacteroides oleiciplenus TaxID=626931 RepID=UPI0026DCCA98|nr:glycosyltransferase family 1 protein [Bacteroides oleiciplenus]
MSKPVRILHVFNFFNQGGVENFVMNVYRNIDREKIQFDFAFPIHQKGYFDDEVISMGGRIFFFDSEKKSLWNYYKNLRRIIRENGPYAAIHSHVYYFSGYILFVAKLCGIKVRIAHSHETLKGREQTVIRKMYQWFMRHMIKANATHCLACSDLAGKYLFSKQVSYQVLYNGIDFQRFTYKNNEREALRQKLGFQEQKILINVGRFAEQKNHVFIINIFKELCSRSSNYRLILIGTGPLKNSIQELCKQYGFEDKVLFLFDIKNTEDYYSTSDVFILPSLYEGMGIVSIEAQATGLPSLLSDKITREVGVTDIAEYLSIEDNVVEWVDRIEIVTEQCIDRTVYVNRLLNSPFNINKTIADLIPIYTTESE